MPVLKKFIVFTLSALLAGQGLYAQSADAARRQDATEFIQQADITQQVEKASAEKNPLLKSTTTTITIPRGQVSDELLAGRIVRREAPKTETAKTEESGSSFGSGVLDWVKEKYSSMLNVMPSQISNVMLYRFIDEWMGTRYRMGGTTKKGVDCSAFVQNLYQYVFGLNLLRTAWMQFESSKYISNISDLKEGDLVFFRINSSRITHVGVYLRNNFFVHSASSKGVSIANLNSDYWSRYFAGGGRVKEQ